MWIAPQRRARAHQRARATQARRLRPRSATATSSTSSTPAEHLTLAVHDQYAPAAEFLGDARVDRDPRARHLRPSTRRWTSPGVRTVADHAYWLSGLDAARRRRRGAARHGRRALGGLRRRRPGARRARRAAAARCAAASLARDAPTPSRVEDVGRGARRRGAPTCSTSRATQRRRASPIARPARAGRAATPTLRRQHRRAGRRSRSRGCGRPPTVHRRGASHVRPRLGVSRAAVASARARPAPRRARRRAALRRSTIFRQTRAAGGCVGERLVRALHATAPRRSPGAARGAPTSTTSCGSRSGARRAALRARPARRALPSPSRLRRRPGGCGALPSFKLTRPVFGGTTRPQARHRLPPRQAAYRARDRAARQARRPALQGAHAARGADLPDEDPPARAASRELPRPAHAEPRRARRRGASRSPRSGSSPTPAATAARGPHEPRRPRARPARSARPPATAGCRRRRPARLRLGSAGGAAPIRPAAGYGFWPSVELLDDPGHLGRHPHPGAVVGARHLAVRHGGEAPGVLSSPAAIVMRTVVVRRRGVGGLSAGRPGAAPCASPRRRPTRSRRARTPPPS